MTKLRNSRVTSQGDSLTSALSLHQSGRRDEAKIVYESILKKHPNNYDALHLLGLIYFESGEFSEAEKLIRRAISLKKNQAEFHSNYGLVLRALGAPDKALQSYELALKLKPTYPAALINRGVVLQDLGRYEQALESFDQAIALEPSAVAYTNRGLALRHLRRYSDAIVAMEKAVALDPGYSEALVNLGSGYAYFGRNAEALSLFNRVIALNPRSVPALNNRGAVLRDLGRYSEALSSLGAALKVDPFYIDALSNMGSLLNDLGRYEEGLRCFEKVLEKNPNHVLANWGKSISYLSADEYNLGWSLYDYRILNPKLGISLIKTNKPVWAPRMHADTVLISDEQGIGDTVFFSSQIPRFNDAARNLIFYVDTRLVKLFSRSFPRVSVVSKEVDVSNLVFDAHMLIGSLFNSLNQVDVTGPRYEPKPYLAVSVEKVARFRAALDYEGRPVIGISWKSFRTGLGEEKSLTLRELRPILEHLDATFVSLQYGNVKDELAEFSNETGIKIVEIPGLDLTNDIDSVAALASACNYVITVSNTVAHLVGALGVTGFVILARGRGRLFYWNNKVGDQSYWYPSLCLFDTDHAGKAAAIQMINDRLSSLLEVNHG